MRSGCRLGTMALVATMVAALLCCSSAAAHKLTVFAAVEGGAIRGEAAFRDGGAAKHVAVKILGPGGEALGQAKTDDSGVFHFQPQKRVDHRLVVDGGGGHAAEFTVTAEELPGKLAAAPAQASGAKPDGNVAAPALETGPETAKPEPVLPQSPASKTAPDVSEQLAQLRAEVARLRKETAEAHDRLRMRDVLGGVGFLLGIGGTAFYFLGLRRKEQTAGKQPGTPQS